MNTAEKSVTISNKISISVKATQRDIDLNAPVYAINWFDTKISWLYKFYSLLAIGNLLKVGGKPFLKAKVQQVIKGEAALQRDTLLIVKYPSADSFLQLVGKKYFQIISFLRRAAVNDFSFGFAVKKSDSPWQKKEGKTHLILHHLQYDDFDLKQLTQLIEESEVEASIVFAGEVNGKVHFKNDKKNQQLPCLMDGLILYKSDDLSALEQFLTTGLYEQLSTSNTKNSSLAKIEREI